MIDNTGVCMSCRREFPEEALRTIPFSMMFEIYICPECHDRARGVGKLIYKEGPSESGQPALRS